MARKSGLTSASITYIDNFCFVLGPEASRVDAERVLGIDPVARLRREHGQDRLRADDIELLGFIIDTDAWLQWPDLSVGSVSFEGTASGLLRML